MPNIDAYAYQDPPHVWCTMWPVCGYGSNKRPKASCNYEEASENFSGQGGMIFITVGPAEHLQTRFSVQQVGG